MRAREDVVERYRTVRDLTEALAAPLHAEDQVVQSMPDVSPTKWHHAHTTWFFETFILQRERPGYRPFHSTFAYLFNSYYEAAGPRHPRPQRGLLSRPTVEDVHRYRCHVDEAMTALVAGADDDDRWSAIAPRLELGLHHEQQHQELLLMDIKHVLSCNPLDPRYTDALVASERPSTPLGWTEHEGGVIEVGHNPADPSFAYDNERPRHRVYLEDFRLGDRLVTAGEWTAFIDDDGYRRPELWLSDGWFALCAEGWEAPLYWRREPDGWSIFTLTGRRPVTEAEPVVHVSHYEADAFARWAGARLPTEYEWEHAAARLSVVGNFLPGGRPAPDPASLHPVAATADASVASRQMFGDVWEWTSSAYLPYPRFTPAAGAIGEYNGKFMSGQMVLRGGACITPEGHLRPTYRNFYPPQSRWVFGGVRLATDA